MQFFSWIVERLRVLPQGAMAKVAGLLLAIMLLYYPLGMLIVHTVDDDPDFKAGAYDIPAGSRTVAIAEALIDREVNQHRWVPNDPWFLPGSMLERMPAFQRGIISSLSRLSVELSDHIGRTRGSSQMDADLQKARGLLSYSPNIWIFDFSTSPLPTASSEAQYRAALAALQNYNNRLSQGHATFEQRADNLLDTLDRIASDMGSSSADIDEHIENNSGTLLDTDADTKFYFIKGQMYGNYLILRELGRDYETVLQERQLQKAWQQMLKSLREGSEISHFFVFNASPDSQFLANHLATQGFYLMRARTQIREITNILLK